MFSGLQLELGSTGGKKWVASSNNNKKTLQKTCPKSMFCMLTVVAVTIAYRFAFLSDWNHTSFVS